MVWLTDERPLAYFQPGATDCQRSSPLRISDTPQAGFEPVQNLRVETFVESCAVVISTPELTIVRCSRKYLFLKYGSKIRAEFLEMLEQRGCNIFSGITVLMVSSLRQFLQIYIQKYALFVV